MDILCPGLSGNIVFRSVHKNTGFWKMHRSAYRVQLPGHSDSARKGKFYPVVTYKRPGCL